MLGRTFSQDASAVSSPASSGLSGVGGAPSSATLPSKGFYGAGGGVHSNINSSFDYVPASAYGNSSGNSNSDNYAVYVNGGPLSSPHFHHEVVVPSVHHHPNSSSTSSGGKNGGGEGGSSLATHV